ncbi:hypothetical protein GJAV_G00072570 [Gymnothorax javanicus]|nr:hypothetical protein GJAV_G00072570 [Gymnothorax javanicus]
MLGERFCLFAAIGLLLWSGAQTQDTVKIFCDDKDVEAAVDLALVTHNGKLQQGNQLALDQIVRALKAERESSTVFTVEFLVRESDCPAGGDKAWRDCDYLPQPDTAPSPCTAVASRSSLEDDLEIVSVECRSSVERRVIPKTAQCLGCRENIDVENEDLREPVLYSLAKFNAEGNSSHHFLLRQIVSATRQVVAGLRYDFHIELEKSNCSKEDFKVPTDECHPAEIEPEFANCNSTVYVAPWRREEPEADISCEPGLSLRSGTWNRKPPGWSPLRHYHDFGARRPPRPFHPSGAPPPTITLEATQMPTPVQSATEESSEESQEVTKPPSLPIIEPGPTADALDDLALLLPLSPPAEPVRPFNCPTKPWKKFVPLTPPPPPPLPAQNDPTPAPEINLADVLLSDLDLVG